MEKNTYPAARCNPVADGEERKAQGHNQHDQTLDSYGLFPQTREVLIPDCQELLLAVRVSHKLLAERDVGDCAIRDTSTTECTCTLKILMHTFLEYRHQKVLVIFSFAFPPFPQNCFRIRIKVATKG